MAEVAAEWGFGFEDAEVAATPRRDAALLRDAAGIVEVQSEAKVEDCIGRPACVGLCVLTLSRMPASYHRLCMIACHCTLPVLARRIVANSCCSERFAVCR
jgi:hypothetical protein